MLKWPQASRGQGRSHQSQTWNEGNRYSFIYNTACHYRYSLHWNYHFLIIYSGRMWSPLVLNRTRGEVRGKWPFFSTLFLSKKKCNINKCQSFLPLPATKRFRWITFIRFRFEKFQVTAFLCCRRRAYFISMIGIFLTFHYTFLVWPILPRITICPRPCVQLYLISMASFMVCPRPFSFNFPLR